MNRLGKLHIVTFLNMAAFYSTNSLAQIHEYEEQKAEHCKILKRHGSNQAKAFMAVERNSCIDYMQHYQNIAAQYWQPLESFETNSYESTCFQSGLKDGFILATEETYNACKNDLSEATKLGYSVGYAACYLMADAVQLSIIPMNDDSFDRHTFDPNSFVVAPVYSSSWINYIFKNTQVGVLFGCLAGEVDRINQKAPNIIEETTPDSYSYKLGSVIGKYLKGDICTNFPLNSVYQAFSPSDKNKFIEGVRSTASKYCGGEL